MHSRWVVTEVHHAHRRGFGRVLQRGRSLSASAAYADGLDLAGTANENLAQNLNIAVVRAVVTVDTGDFGGGFKRNDLAKRPPVRLERYGYYAVPRSDEFGRAGCFLAEVHTGARHGLAARVSSRHVIPSFPQTL